jgi:hypothetical protein
MNRTAQGRSQGALEAEIIRKHVKQRRLGIDHHGLGSLIHSDFEFFCHVVLRDLLARLFTRLAAMISAGRRRQNCPRLGAIRDLQSLRSRV